MEKAIQALVGLSEIQVSKVEVQEGELVYQPHCRLCLKKGPFVKQRTTGRVGDLALTGQKVYLELTTGEDWNRHF